MNIKLLHLVDLLHCHLGLQAQQSAKSAILTVIMRWIKLTRHT